MEVHMTFKIHPWRHYKDAVYSGFNTLKAENTRGQHQAGKSNKDVKGIGFFFYTINSFPRGLNNIFENLTRLMIHRCGLASLTHEDLKGLEKIEAIFIEKNKLTSLPSDLFVGFHNLQIIEFSDNKIEYLSSRLLQPIIENGLLLVNFKRNKKIDIYYQRDQADDGTTLQQLMDAMDECKKPLGDPGFDGSFKKFADMWKTRAFSDYTIVAKSRVIQVHRCILANQSQVFASAFTNEEHKSQMTIKDFSVESIEQFLRFFYTARIPDDTCLIDLFVLATKFGVEDLKAKCERKILRNLDVGNAFEIFSLGHFCSAPDMKKTAFDVIKESMPDKNLDESLLNDIQGLKATVDAARKLGETARRLQEAVQIYNEALEEFESLKAERSTEGNQIVRRDDNQEQSE